MFWYILVVGVVQCVCCVGVMGVRVGCLRACVYKRVSVGGVGRAGVGRVGRVRARCGRVAAPAAVRAARHAPRALHRHPTTHALTRIASGRGRARSGGRAGCGPRCGRCPAPAPPPPCGNPARYNPLPSTLKLIDTIIPHLVLHHSIFTLFQTKIFFSNYIVAPIL